MKARLVLLALVGSLLAADDPDAGKKKSDQQRLQGTWTAKSIEFGGEQVLGDTVKDLQLVIAGNKLSVKGEGDLEKYAKLTFKLDPSTTPKIIDITVTAGNDKGTVLEGIYELKGDQLKLCVQIIGKERPSEFKSASGSQTALAVLKREP